MENKVSESTSSRDKQVESQTSFIDKNRAKESFPSHNSIETSIAFTAWFGAQQDTKKILPIRNSLAENGCLSGKTNIFEFISLISVRKTTLKSGEEIGEKLFFFLQPYFTVRVGFLTCKGREETFTRKDGKKTIPFEDRKNNYDRKKKFHGATELNGTSKLHAQVTCST